jgi:hypothetical protein
MGKWVGALKAGAASSKKAACSAGYGLRLTEPSLVAIDVSKFAGRVRLEDRLYSHLIYGVLSQRKFPSQAQIGLGFW